MKKLSLLLFVLLASITTMLSQKTVTGSIVDSNGDPLIGANVLVQGTTAGTVTDIDGNFSLEVPTENQNLLFSYIGFTDQVIDVSDLTSIDVILSEGQLLDEIVVNGLGVERNARNVAYANQTVDADDLLSSPNKNALSALRGKVAGVKISTGSGSVGASTRIVLRGEGSLTGNNNALIVIDGVPIDNSSELGSSSSTLAGSASTGYADFGNRFNDLNPDDIESVTVLKGPSATSLYGSRGASGVLVITTKNGSSEEDGNMKVGYNGTFSVENAYVLLQRQDQYGQGYGLPFASTPARDSGENWSWGPAFDGVVRPWTSPVDADGDGTLEYLSRPYNAVPNQLENFFRQGSTLSNSVNLSGNKGGFNYYASYSNLAQDGILENTDYNRNTLKFSAGAKLSKRLQTNFSASYSGVNLNSAQEGSRPFEGQNAYANAVQSPVNIPFGELRDYNNPYHGFDGYYGSYTTNPYFILNEYINEGKINNVLGNFALTYNVLDGLDLVGRIGANIVNSNFEQASPVHSYNPHFVWTGDLNSSLRNRGNSNPGDYSRTERATSTLDLSLLANYSRDLTSNGDFTLNSTVGFNDFSRNINRVTGQTVGGLVVPGFYNLSNSVQAPTSTQYKEDYRIMGLFGNVNVGYKNMVFLDYSARNDWSSTLPADNNSFFYQAIGGSAILSDILGMQDNDVVDMIKLRASVGTTGKDTDPYQIASVFVGNPVLQTLANGHDLTFPLNGQAGFTKGNRIGNGTLRPELTTTYEVGADLGLLRDKISLEYTYYQSQHTNQLVVVSLPASTGFTSTVKNIGEIKNQGHELALTLRPIAGMVKDLSWDINLLWATNTNEVLKVSDEQDELSLGNFGGVSTVAQVGLPYGSYKGINLKTDPNGNQIVDAQGLPVRTADSEILGSYQPDYTASLGTAIGYKGFGFNILFDVRQGGKFLSYTKDLTEFNGTSLTTLLGDDRGAFVVENSVVDNGDGTYSPNTVAVAPYDYVRTLPFSQHLIDASFVKLREVGLTYTPSSKLIKKSPFSNVSVKLFGQNLKFWLPSENVFADPEVNGPALAGNASGIETTQTPPSQSYGVNLSLTF